MKCKAQIRTYYSTPFLSRKLDILDWEMLRSEDFALTGKSQARLGASLGCIIRVRVPGSDTHNDNDDSISESDARGVRVAQCRPGSDGLQPPEKYHPNTATAQKRYSNFAQEIFVTGPN